MKVEGQVGPQIVADGAFNEFRLGKSAEQIVTELHGKYYEQVYRGNVFSVAQATAGVLLNNLGTTASFSLANPAGSGKNLVPIKFEMVIKALPGTPVVGYYLLAVNTNPVGAAVTGTALTPVNALLGIGANSVAKPFTTSTLPASPSIFRVIQTKLTGIATTLPYIPPATYEFDGSCIVTPGCTISVFQDAADTTNATAQCTITWEEVLV